MSHLSAHGFSLWSTTAANFVVVAVLSERGSVNAAALVVQRRQNVHPGNDSSDANEAYILLLLLLLLLLFLWLMLLLLLWLIFLLLLLLLLLWLWLQRSAVVAAAVALVIDFVHNLISRMMTLVSSPGRIEAAGCSIIVQRQW